MSEERISFHTSPYSTLFDTKLKDNEKVYPLNKIKSYKQLFCLAFEYKVYMIISSIGIFY